MRFANLPLSFIAIAHNMGDRLFMGKERSQLKFLVHHLRIDLYFEVFVENNDVHDEYAQLLALDPTVSLTVNKILNCFL
ncbi:MAG: hypothetical protein HEQ35_26285 [Gloeotrichia echinulata IR180]